MTGKGSAITGTNPYCWTLTDQFVVRTSSNRSIASGAWPTVSYTQLRAKRHQQLLTVGACGHCRCVLAWPVRDDIPGVATPQLHACTTDRIIKACLQSLYVSLGRSYISSATSTNCNCKLWLFHIQAVEKISLLNYSVQTQSTVTRGLASCTPC